MTPFTVPSDDALPYSLRRDLHRAVSKVMANEGNAMAGRQRRYQQIAEGAQPTEIEAGVMHLLAGA